MASRTAHCTSPNRTTIVLQNFDPDKNTIAADLASMFRNADLGQLARGGGCMSGPDDACQPVMRDLGVTFRGQQGSKQQLFSVR
jgi:hypothetical protein